MPKNYVLIHGKRYKHVGEYYEQRLGALCCAIEELGWLTVTNYTTMPWFHKDYGRPDDFLQHLVLEPTRNNATCDISSDLIYMINQVDHVIWHSFSPDPKENKVWLHFQIL